MSAALVAFARPARAVIVNGSGLVTASGTDLGAYLGDAAFYSQGYTGTRATLVNVELGLAWNGHQSLTQLKYMPLVDGEVNSIQAHATGVAAIMAGEGTRPLDLGIAYGAKIASGTVSTASGYTVASFGDTYDAAVTGFTPTDGSATMKADVINSSWGILGQYAGNGQLCTMLDGMVAQNGTLIVAAAGNSGPGANTQAQPSTALNAMAVASLHSTISPEITPSYTSVSTFSSRGPTYVLLPGMVVPATRAAISIAAPGEDFSLASYNGPGTVPNWYSFDASGTSYASPTVSGAAGLLVDVGYAKFVTPVNRTAISAPVLRAVLMNSATKTDGWNNGQTLINGVVTTTQALDYAVGAGALNIGASYPQYTAGTTGGVVPVPGQRSPVADIGWNYATVAPSTSHLYELAGTLQAGATLTTTLCWLADATYIASADNGNLNALINLTLEVDLVNANDTLTRVAISEADDNTAQHLYFSLPDTGTYVIQVNYAGQDYGAPEATNYALAWNVSVPEPGLAVLVVPALLVSGRRRRVG
jgi:hypothetical protein